MKSFNIVSTFTENRFQGNSAAVFISEKNLTDLTLCQQIATEINAPETIFIEQNTETNFKAICFTPKVHGLFLGNSLYAAAQIIYELNPICKNFTIEVDKITYPVSILPDKSIQITFDLPNLIKVPIPHYIHVALQEEIIVSVNKFNNDLIVEIRNPNRLEKLTPNLDLLKNIEYNSIIITTDTHYETNLTYDYCAKVFLPKIDIYNNMLTPLSHRILAKYWQSRLKKNELVGFCPAENRSGYIYLKISNNIVNIRGFCSVSATGELVAA